MGTWVLILVPDDKREEFRKMGDVNRDGIIDDADIELLRAAFGSRPGSANWNPDCDLDGDGVVDMKDITITIQNYGKDIFSWMGWGSQGIVEWSIIGGVLTAIGTVGGAIYYFATQPR